jgi:hypothetical protein
MLTRRQGNATNDRGRARHPFGTGLSALVVLLAGLGFLVVPETPASAAPPAQGWSTTEAPLPSDAGNGSTNPQVYQASAACAAQNSCTTVGWYNDTSGQPWGLIEMQNGTTWTDVQAPQPNNAGSGSHQGLWLGSQNCGVGLLVPCQANAAPSPAVQFAVGSYITTTGGTQAVIETYSNGSWTALQAPVPSDASTSNPFAILVSITCTSTSSCVAVGQYFNTSNQTVPLIETLSATGWTAQTASPPSGAASDPQMFLGYVACSSASSCVAVGRYVPGTGGLKPLMVTLSGGSWSAATAPQPSDAFTGTNPTANLLRVTCMPSGSCVAVGLYQKTAGFAGLIETESGGVWTPTAAPEPSGAATGASQSATLMGLSCGSSLACVAVGQYFDTNGRPWGFVVSGSGTSWTAAQVPLPSGAAPETSTSSELLSVSCPSPAFCLAVGTYVSAAGAGTGYVAQLQGGKWSVMTAPVPSNIQPSPTFASILKTVACWSRVACVASGWYEDPGNVQGVLDTWTGAQGYWLDASDGGIFTYPNNLFYGSTGGLKLNAPMVGMAATPDAQGYWLVASDGGIFSYGDALFHGSRGGQPLNAPIVGMAATPTGNGYWLVASDGGIFNYGDAGFFGSRGGQPLNKPIVGLAATADGQGYWLVASDGGIFSYGDALFYGSTGALKLNKPVVGMASTPTGLGYWLVASDGGIFNYGDGQFYGSTGSIVLNKPVVGMAGSPSGQGYWLVASDGGVFNYGDAPFQGSAGALHLNAPVVGMAGG